MNPPLDQQYSMASLVESVNKNEIINQFCAKCF